MDEALEINKELKIIFSFSRKEKELKTSSPSAVLWEKTILHIFYIWLNFTILFCFLFKKLFSKLSMGDKCELLTLQDV